MTIMILVIITVKHNTLIMCKWDSAFFLYKNDVPNALVIFTRIPSKDIQCDFKDKKTEMLAIYWKESLSNIEKNILGFVLNLHQHLSDSDEYQQS